MRVVPEDGLLVLLGGLLGFERFEEGGGRGERRGLCGCDWEWGELGNVRSTKYGRTECFEGIRVERLCRNLLQRLQERDVVLVYIGDMRRGRGEERNS